MSEQTALEKWLGNFRNLSEDELKASIHEQVKDIVVDQLSVEADEVTEEATFIDDLGADSLDIVELIMAFEEEFGIDIPDEATEKIKTVQDVVEYVSKSLQEQA